VAVSLFQFYFLIKTLIITNNFINTFFNGKVSATPHAGKKLNLIFSTDEKERS